MGLSLGSKSTQKDRGEGYTQITVSTLRENKVSESENIGSSIVIVHCYLRLESRS